MIHDPDTHEGRLEKGLANAPWRGGYMAALHEDHCIDDPCKCDCDPEVVIVALCGKA